MKARWPSTLTVVGAVAPVVWGTTYVVTTELLPPGRPMTAAVLRAVPAGVLLLLFTRQRPRQWGRLLVLGLVNIGAFFPLLFVAAYRLPGGLAAVVGAGQPFIVAVAAWVLLGQRTPGRQLRWAAVAVVGVAMTMLTGTLVLDPVGMIAATSGTTLLGWLTLGQEFTLTQTLGFTRLVSDRRKSLPLAMTTRGTSVASDAPRDVTGRLARWWWRCACDGLHVPV